MKSTQVKPLLIVCALLLGCSPTPRGVIYNSPIVERPRASVITAPPTPTVAPAPVVEAVKAKKPKRPRTGKPRSAARPPKIARPEATAAAQADLKQALHGHDQTPPSRGVAEGSLREVGARIDDQAHNAMGEVGSNK
jgi:hypothetical protein